IKMYYAISKERNDKNQMVEALNLLFVQDLHTGNYEKGFFYLERLHEMATKEKNKFWLADSWWGLGLMYRTIEDFTTALTYYRQVYHQYQTDEAYQKKLINNDVDIWLKMELAEIFSQLHQFDSAWFYYRLFKPEKPVYQRIYRISTGECLLLQKQYGAALQNFYPGLAEHQKLNDHNEIKRALLDIGKTYLALGNLEKAKEFGAQGLHLALQTKSKQFIRDGYQILASVYDKQHHTDSANHYFRLAVTMKDEVLSDQAKGRIAAYQYEQKIALANKEIGLHAAQLKNEIFEKRVLTGGLALLLILVVIIVRNITLKRRNEKQRLQHELDLQQLESEQTKARLQQQATALEMQALRAQMNPHFIFNSLNAINNFILQNNKLQASDYLAKFSRLVRLILQNSRAAFIPLESELEALTLYLELEALRFDHHFDYHITVEGDLDVSVLKVPPLIIQPYVENAIWHGLMHKEEKGHLAIAISQNEEVLLCRITDDGIGRKKAAENKSRSTSTHPSLGMRITAERIAALHKEKQRDGCVDIHDLTLPDGSPGGTEVTLKIPVHYD
ncbi:MAG TPA: histidine kinase, partial [Flavisolibacter sp.]|nr:histidine kinase [Flavisolibacter sp.]